MSDNKQSSEFPLITKYVEARCGPRSAKLADAFLFLGLTAFVLGYFAILIGILVFGVQALRLGRETRESCSEVAVWMIAFGALVMSFLGCCICMSVDFSGMLFSVFFLTIFGWSSYGMHLVYHEPAQRIACNPSQFDTFSLMVKFVFYGILSIIIPLIALISFRCCCMKEVDDETEISCCPSCVEWYKSEKDKDIPISVRCWEYVSNVTFAILSILFSITSIIQLGFGIQGLVVGANSYLACYETGVWMIVFGSLTLAYFVLTCCGGTICFPVFNDKLSDEDPEYYSKSETIVIADANDYRLWQTSQILLMIIICWLCYGMYLVYNDPDQRKACNPSQFDTLSLMVNFCFICNILNFFFCMYMQLTVFVLKPLLKDEDGKMRRRRHPDQAEVPVTPKSQTSLFQDPQKNVKATHLWGNCQQPQADTSSISVTTPTFSTLSSLENKLDPEAAASGSSGMSNRSMMPPTNDVKSFGEDSVVIPQTFKQHANVVSGIINHSATPSESVNVV